MMYYFIVNPKSSSGKGLKIWGRAAEKLQQNKTEYKVFFTEYREHASELAHQLSSEGKECTIVAVGGDGTANEVIDGLCNYDKIHFGYIPTGSGNDLARGLSLPIAPEDALTAILHPAVIKKISIGEIHADDCTHRFAVSCGIGFDAAVCHEAMNSRIKNALNRLGLGKLTYLGIALKQLILLRSSSFTLTLDDGEPLDFPNSFFAAFMNLKYEGGGFMFCPKANAQDEFIDICLVEKMPKLKVLLLLPTAFKGQHTHFKGIHILRCKKASIKASDALAIHTDGESQNFHANMEVSLISEQLPFIVG